MVNPEGPSHCPIFPSLLSADCLRLGEDIDALIQAGVTMLHLDVMDNHYVPNLTFGPNIAHAIHQRFPTLSLDVHLMVKPVDALIEQFAAAGAARISIHPDSTIHLDRSLQRIQDLGCKAGLVLNPSTPIDVLHWCLHRLDFVLIMTVNPGFGGQRLIPEMVSKISAIQTLFPALPIAVDGGINLDNIATLARAGASEFIVGSAFFHNTDYRKTLASLNQQLHLQPLSDHAPN